MLDKNEGILLNWLDKELADNFPGLAILPKQIRDPRYVVCDEHNING